jgi:site-specific DNA recombinase
MAGRAAIYARQSITREGSASREAQVESCREAAARLGLEVVATLIEAPSTSGYRNRGRTRPKFLELLDLIRSGQVDCVIAYKTDRLSRGGGPGWAPLVEAFEAAGAHPDRAVATPDGWVSEFEIGIRSAMDREESKKTAERMADVRAREARDGKPRVGGRRAYGYDAAMTQIVHEEAESIAEAADRVLGGETVWSIVTDWNARGVPTVTGGSWTVQTLSSILRSPRLAGLREHRGVVVGPGSWPRILEQEIHERLKRALLAKRPSGRRVRTYDLVGFLRCGRCQRPLRSLARENGRRSYACRSGPGLGGCGGIRIQADALEAHVRDLVCGTLADPKARRVLAKLAASEAADTELVAEMRSLEERRERLVDLYTDGEIDRAAFRRRRDDIDNELNRLETQFAGCSSSVVAAALPTSADELLDLWQTNGIDFRRSLIGAIVSSVTVMPAERPSRIFDPSRLQLDLRA